MFPLAVVEVNATANERCSAWLRTVIALIHASRDPIADGEILVQPYGRAPSAPGLLGGTGGMGGHGATRRRHGAKEINGYKRTGVTWADDSARHGAHEINHTTHPAQTGALGTRPFPLLVLTERPRMFPPPRTSVHSVINVFFANPLRRASRPKNLRSIAGELAVGVTRWPWHNRSSR